MIEDPADVLRIRCVELLACGGWRINELLTLPADCEVFDPVTENGSPVLDAEGKQVERYGIRYFGEKGAGPRIKWIPTPMVDVAKRAVSDIAAITKPARDTLMWMAAHRGRAKLPGAWNESGPHAQLSTAELRNMFGLEDGATFVRTYKIPYVLKNGRWLVERADLEASLLSAQKELSQSAVPLRPEQYLFVMPRNWAHRTRGVIASIIDPVMDQQISGLICGRDGVSTIFSRFGFTEEDGRPIEVTTHQLRHWLNTLAQQGGMSQMEIARWSGRKDVAQNAEYDHRSGFEMAKRARELLAKGRVHGPIAEIHNRLPPVRREDFRETQITTAHTTDIGMCTNDWSLVPCNEHGGCAGCAQHLVEKGNKAQFSRAEIQLEEHRRLLEHAESEASEETYGASNYVAHHRRTCDALTKIIGIHADPAVPDGDLVHISLGPVRAHESRLMERR